MAIETTTRQSGMAEYHTWLAQWKDARGEVRSREFAQEQAAAAFIGRLPMNTISASYRLARMAGTPKCERT